MHTHRRHQLLSAREHNTELRCERGQGQWECQLGAAAAQRPVEAELGDGLLVQLRVAERVQRRKLRLLQILLAAPSGKPLRTDVALARAGRGCARTSRRTPVRISTNSL